MSDEVLAREMFCALGDMIDAQGRELSPEFKESGRKMVDLILSLAEREDEGT